MVGAVIRDFKYAIRSFVRRPLFTAVIVLTLALGIGSNVAMFSVANAVLLRALPYDHPEELALVWTRLQATNVERSLVSGPDFGDYQTQTTRFEGFAGAAAVPGTLTGAGQAERIVAVGRGIKAQEHIALAEKLAAALGAQLAASRPICDSGWLPIERQVGSSGQTVAPKLYIALGISGATQHLVGMKGSDNIIAVNKDGEAPIFGIADLGVVGDVHKVVPKLIEAIQARK